MGGELGGTPGSIHGLGYLFSALRHERLIADQLVLQLATFLRSLDLFLELIVLTTSTLFIPACPVLTSLPRSLQLKD